MRVFILLIFMLAVSISCNPESKTKSRVVVKSPKKYELHKAPDSKQVLIVFPGGGNTIKMTKEEFKIIPKAIENDISVLVMNFNRCLWVNGIQVKELAMQIKEIFRSNEMSTADVYMGGMSIGGNVALSLTSFQIKSNSTVQSKGVFIVDSPIDLYSLYQSCMVDIANPELGKERLAEPRWIVDYFEEHFDKDSILENILKESPYTLKVQKNNFEELKETKLRFYTEPDSLWWQENRMTQYENTNAYSIEQVAQQLRKEGWEKLELIQTKNKGYRSNGDRHPHSWSIVDLDEIIMWMNK